MMTPEWLDRIERDWHNLPAWRDYADYVDTSQRLQELAFIQHTSRMTAEEFAGGWHLKSTCIPTKPWLLQFYLAHVDWDQIMIDANERIDRVRDIVAESDLNERARRLDWFDNTNDEYTRSCATPKLCAEQSIHRLIVVSAARSLAYMTETTPRNIETRSQYIRIAIAVERFRLAHGELPATLYQLVPDYLDEVPVDPYAPTQRVQFFPTANSGYIIHNAGHRLLDEVEPLPDENRYSFRVRMPVAPWLLPDETP